VAVGYQHWHDHRYILDGFSDLNSQDRDSGAIQVKLEELVRVQQ
jgi:hypothetical protein